MRSFARSEDEVHAPTNPVDIHDHERESSPPICLLTPHPLSPHPSPVVSSPLTLCLLTPHHDQNAPFMLNTAGTVRARIPRSRHTVQPRMYVDSSRTTSSKLVIAFRPL